MNFRLKNSSCIVGNNDIIRFKRARLIQPNQQESKSIATVKINLSPELKPKKQNTIHHNSVQDENLIIQKQNEKNKICKAKLQELFSLRKSSLTPLLKQQIYRQQTIIKYQPDFVKDQELYDKIRKQSIQNLQTKEKQKSYVQKSQECTQKKRVLSNNLLSSNYLYGTSMLNQSVSQFNCLTPKKNENTSINYYQKENIKRQKLEGLINLLINIKIENIVLAFNSIKSKAPMLRFIKEFERRKEEFLQKRFFIQLVKVQ